MPPVQHTFGYAAALALGLFCVVGVYVKTAQDERHALKVYQEEQTKEAAIAAKKMDEALTQIYQNLRTISFLPSVRNIDRHGTNLDENARQSIQQIYNNLASTVAMSEVYVVPADLDPTRIDPTTGQPEVPTLMFDTLLFDPTQKEANEPARDPSLPEEEEKEEYAQLHQLGQWLQKTYPTNAGLEALKTPMVAGSPVITCDNSDFDTTRKDEDRTGVMFSVPFFGMDGLLKGTITGVVRSNALRALLPEANYALVNPAYGITFGSSKPGQQQASAAFAAKAQPDPSLLFSRVLPLAVNDPRGAWSLWVGLPRADFLNGAELHAIRMFRYGGFALAALLTAVGIFIVRRILAQMEAQALTKKFQGATRDIISHLVSASTQMQHSMENVTAIAEKTKQRTAQVATISASTAQSSGQIAAAAEELSASIQEVSRQATQSRTAVQGSLTQAESAKTAITELSEKSSKVGEIVDVITSIASNINLLALNASIEAARAGSAGVGFAVVATEVKALAAQVEKAAEEITTQINDMQKATRASVKGVNAVLEGISEVSHSSTGVATAVQQQSAATAEIVANISHTATGAQDISSTITHVQTDAEHTSSASHEVLDAAKTLAAQATSLKTEVDTFLRGLHMA